MLLKKYMTMHRSEIDIFSKPQRFPIPGLSGSNTPSRAVFLLKSSIQADKLSRIQQGKSDSKFLCILIFIDAQPHESFQ